MIAKSVAQLDAEYPNAQWRSKYLAICDLMELLSACIIDVEYHIPDQMNDAISLTKSGAAIVDRLQRKEGVPVKEAKLMCALTVGHAELFVDVDSTDLDSLRASIDLQLKSGAIKFPYIFGRRLYDAFALRFDEERRDLSVEETQDLLSVLPVGIVQVGTFLTGPLGLLESSEGRVLPTSRSVPAYHCSESICERVHSTHLSTSQEAPVNKHRPTLRRILDEDTSKASEWWSFAREISGEKASYFADAAAAPTATLLGDGLTSSELRLLLIELINSKTSGLREIADLPSRSAEEVADSYDPSAQLQIILLCREREIVACLDRLVRGGSIVVPQGEIRKSVTNSLARSGAFRLTAELGKHGVRFVSTDPGTASLRLRRLLRSLYVQALEEDSAELDWQLRGYDAENADERLERFFRTEDPEAALRRLVLVRKTNMLAACEEAGLEDGDALSDDELVSALLWKLGFPSRVLEDGSAKLWGYHDNVQRLTRASRISGIGDSVEFLGAATTFFVELEGVLSESLAFSTWALCHDHIAAKSPFRFVPHEHITWAMEKLNEMFEASGAHGESITFTTDTTALAPIIRGFGILAKGLRAAVEVEESHTRPRDQYPEYFEMTSLKDFVFQHSVPFLDLLPASQEAILGVLERVSAGLQAAGVAVVRNDYSHYRRTEREIQKVEDALDAIRAAVSKLEEAGLVRASMWPDTVREDAWGRSQHRFVGPRGREQLFARPSPYDWMGLPSLDQTQYIVGSAKFAEPNETLRFVRQLESEYSKLWAGFPQRRRKPEEIMGATERSSQHPSGIPITGSTV